MSKKDYAIKMIEFHSRLLIKWTKYLEKQYIKSKKEAVEVPKGQISLFELEEKWNYLNLGV